MKHSIDQNNFLKPCIIVYALIQFYKIPIFWRFWTLKNQKEKKKSHRAKGRHFLRCVFPLHTWLQNPQVIKAVSREAVLSQLKDSLEWDCFDNAWVLKSHVSRKNTPKKMEPLRDDFFISSLFFSVQSLRKYVFLTFHDFWDVQYIAQFEQGMVAPNAAAAVDVAESSFQSCRADFFSHAKKLGVFWLPSKKLGVFWPVA